MNLVSQIPFLVFVVILVACGDAASVTDHHLVDSANHLNDEPIEKNEKPATVVETIKLEGMTTPVASADGKVQTIHYGLTIDFESPQKPPALWKTGGGSNVLRAFADDVMKKFQFEQIQDADFEARYCADLKDFLNLHIVTKALRVEMTELRVEPREEHGRFDPVVDAWLKLENLVTPVPASGGKVSTVRYGLLIRFEGNVTEQAETMARWEQSRNHDVLRSFADDVMKKYDMDRVRDESFKRVYAEELRKTINLQITDKVDRIVVTELRYD